ncbi:MAG TPA: DNA repair protein RecO [Candidatus Acidoferrales bacterium]|nr:DNA repair protein RecO [Candidatus Acidoferrales bacterium]
MPPVYATRSIVLRSQPFGESDQIVCFLTEDHGKVTGIAKGAKRSRRRFVNSLEPFSIVNLRFQDYPQRSLAFIHGCELLQAFRRLTKNLASIACAAYLTEITAELTREREQNPALFSHLRDGLTYLNEQDVCRGFLIFFELKLLRLAGYEPMFESCCRCKQSWRAHAGSWFFSCRDGGILCASCARLRRDAVLVSAQTLSAVSSLRAQESFAGEGPFADATAVREMRLLLPRFIQFQINKELKSARFLSSFCSF